MARLLATRTLTVLAAALLVSAFALATVFSPSLPLILLLSMADETLPQRLQQIVQLHLPSWVWSWIGIPLLVRPAWLLPASLGLIIAGAAATMANRHAPRSHRRRS